jgi:uncharacterized phiE125 gp8 family phage protein
MTTPARSTGGRFPTVGECARVLITAPTAEAVTAAEVRTMLGLSASDPSDDLLAAMISATVGTLDAATGGWLGRALMPQTWELRLDGFPTGVIRLPYPPLISVTSVEYDDTAGVEQTLTEGTDYRVFSGGQGMAHIEPVYNTTWPIARCDTESVRVQYVAGYAAGETPAAIKAAIALGVKHLVSTSERNLYMQREDIPGVRSRQWVVSEAAGKAIEAAICGLLSNYRVYG